MTSDSSTSPEIHAQENNVQTNAQENPPSYAIHFTKTSLKEWKKLGKTVQEQFKKKLKERRQSPHIVSAQLSNDLAGCYKIKLRSAGYRLVYQVKDDVLVIVVIAVDKRETVYETAQDRLQ